MAFFLIGRGPDDDLRLVSPKSFESRQAAMAELSNLSAEPSFAHWDAEVSVMDLDTGAPVLLVRSAATPTVEPVMAESDAAGAWEADIPAAAPEEYAAAAVAEEATPEPEEPVVEEPTAFASEPETASAQEAPIAELEPAAAEVVPDAIEAPFWEPPSIALIEPVGDAAIADAILEEASASEPASEAAPAAEEPAAVEAPVAVEEAEAVPAAAESEAELEPASVAAAPAAPEAPVEEAAPIPAGYSLGMSTPAPVDENDELRAAILRTTEHMSAEGIVPPESVGLAPTELESATDAEPKAAAEAQTEPVSVAEEPVVAELEEAARPESEEAAPVESEQQQPESAAAAESQPAQAESNPPQKVGFWPWARAANSADAEAAGVAPEVAGVYDALQEPATELPEPDVEAVLRNSVLLPVEESAPETEGESAPHVPMSSRPLPDAGAYAPMPDAAVDSSDFILDLDALESAPVAAAIESDAPVEPKASDAWSFGGPETLPTDEAVASEASPAADSEPQAAVVSPLQDYTCEDCVYVSTCPNRDQRLPKDCGSFQWR